MDPFEVVIRGERFRISPRPKQFGAVSCDFDWVNGPLQGKYGFTVGWTTGVPAREELIAEARRFVEAFYAPGGDGETFFPDHAPARVQPDDGR
jgi:hypothetical protein